MTCLGSNLPSKVKGWAEAATTIEQHITASRAPERSCMLEDVGRKDSSMGWM